MNFGLHGLAASRGSVAVFLTILAAFITACQPAHDNAESQAASPPALELNQADLVQATEQSLSASTRITGSLHATRQSSVHAQGNAIVQSILANNGDAVQKGQVLVTLNDQDNRARLAQAQASLAQARAQQILSNSIRDRNIQLYRKGFLSEIELERSKADALAQQEQVNAQRALLQISEKALQDAVLRAPLSGVVTDRLIDVGQTVAGGQNLLSIVDPSSLELQAIINPDAQAALKIGQPITFHLQGLPEQQFQAKIQRIAAQADPSNRSLTVYATLDQSSPQLRAGVFVEGTLRYGKTERGIVLPKNSIQMADASNTSNYVWLITANQLQKQPVTIRSIDPVSELAVVDGIQPNSQVVRIALAQGAAGRTVKITP